MADNNLARSRNDGPEIFADDDPLAQLARIVGYEDRVVGQPDQSARPASHLASPQSAVSSAANGGAETGYGRREPIFNLEDELLREFERYDAPRLDPANDIPLDAGGFTARGYSEPAAPVEQAPYAEAPVAYQPEPVAEPVFEAPPQVFAEPTVADTKPQADPFHEDPFFADAPAAEPVFEAPAFETAEPAAPFHWEAEPAGPVEPVRHHQADAYEAPALTAASVAAPMVEVEPAHEIETHEIDMFDLAAELESSMGVADEPVAPAAAYVAPQAEAISAPIEAAAIASAPAAAAIAPVEPAAPAVKRNTGYTPGFRMPLANFNLHQGTTSLMREPAPVVADIPAPVAEAPKPVEAAVEAPKPSDKFSAMDELLYDVARFPQPAQPVTPSGLQPMASLPGVTMPSLGATMAVAAAPVVVAPVAAKAPAVSEPDPFADEDFELALDDLELDLADVVAENNRGPSVAAPVVSVAPAVMAQVAAPQARIEPVISAPVPAAAPVAASVVPPAAPELPPVQEEMLGEADLPFDPALLSETEDHPEAIADLNVPDLPVEEPEQEVAYTPEYDIDIDAELATLLSEPEPAKPAAPAPKAAAAMAATAGAAALGAAAHAASRQSQPAAAERQAYSDLDEFERALEEDFRRSLANPLPVSAHDEDRYVAELDDERPRRSLRSWAIPAVALGVVVALGGGAYALLGGGVSKMVGSGEPVVIAADKDPIKVVPETRAARRCRTRTRPSTTVSPALRLKHPSSSS